MPNIFTVALAWVAGWIVKAHRALWQREASRVQTAVLTGTPTKEKCVYGVVLSGGEFTPGGTYDLNYGYPTTKSLDYYAAKGMGVIRFPVLWERVQPVKDGPLDTLELSRIDPIVDYALSKGFKVGLDVHN